MCVIKMKLINGIIILTGLLLAVAYDDLSKNKVATQSTTAVSSTDDFIPSNAVDRDITTCMRANPIGTSSVDKTVWWRVDLGGVYNIYSVNILFKNYSRHEIRQRGRFAGFSLYISNTGEMDSSSLCYKDGPQLPSLQFTTTCFTSGRYVTFYNERLDGITYPKKYETATAYTELCEVIVHGCKTYGVYGNNCDELCPPNCKENVCHIQNGTCFGCTPGWTGSTCYTQCAKGWYGLDCKQRCSGHCINNAVCNHVTGGCDGGCVAGWMGVLCDKGCIQSYGEKCEYYCSKHCVNQTCSRFHGICQFGCESGYHGQKCEEEFPSTLLSGFIGASISACVFIATAVVIFLLRRKEFFCFGKNSSGTKDSTYAEIDNQRSGDSTYQELSVTRNQELTV